MGKPLDKLLYEARHQLPMWTVYDHPTDFPDAYVARLWLTVPEPIATGFLLRSRELGPLRDELAGLGFVRLERNPEDDPKILETWL